MSELYSNFAISALASGIGAGDTSLQVKTGKGALFPSPTGSDFFRLVMIKKSTGEKEIAFCTARSVDTLTITRAQEDTTALVLNADDPVENRPTAGFFSSLSLTSTEVQANDFNYAADSGVADAYEATLDPVPGATGAGFPVDFIPAADNTGACTLNVNSLGATAIKLMDGTDPLAGHLKAGYPAKVIHNGSIWVLINPQRTISSVAESVIEKATLANMRSALGLRSYAEEEIPANVSGFTRAGTYFGRTANTDADNNWFFLVLAGVLENNYQGMTVNNSDSTFGPTDSGMDVIWPALDNLPADCRRIRVRFRYAMNNPSSGGVRTEFHIQTWDYKAETSNYAGVTGRIAHRQGGWCDGPATGDETTNDSIDIAIDSSHRFVMGHGFNGFDSIAWYSIQLDGFWA